ncbi:hypothetical protein GOODEAATRI_001629 [Goodea atripinnis]|uniref:Uncharacterized protein n=1 Tax=Goodea atripinnis TaxID=208336 RepID=A0ABV0N731_9TELE
MLSFVPRFALRFIRPDPRARVTDPVGDVVSFIHSFEEKYGRSHPVFYQGTYSQALRENTYPFLAIIMLKDRKMTVVGRLEGVIQPEDLINQLTFIIDANQTYLMSERLERYSTASV